MKTNFDLFLKANDVTNKEATFTVDFNFTHAYLRYDKDVNKRFVRVEAQELMHCDPLQGFSYLQKAIQELRGDEIDVASGNDFRVELNDDVLVFDNRGGKNTSFRGWTGGYDPSYERSRDLLNIGFMHQKES